MSPTTRLTAIVLFAIVTVELGGSGGFFLHLLVGEEGTPSGGTWMTRSGAVLLAVALVSLGVGIWRGQEQKPVSP
jgi:hypothetical protein